MLSREGAAGTSCSQSRSSAGHGAPVVVVFFVAFAASCALLGRSLPFPPVLIVRDKIEYLARHGDEYDVLFIGSSHVQGQVMPSVFDPIVRRGGRPVKSFNAGVAGMFSPEDSYLLEQILQLPHHRLRWVFFELSHVRTGLEREGTARFVYWHDWPRVRLLLRRLWQEAQEGSAQLANHGHAAFAARWDTWSAAGQKMVGHLRQSFARAVNLGRGSDLLDRWIRPRDRAREIAKSLGENGDGWMSAFGVSQEMAAAPRAEYLRAYEERLATPAVLERSDPVSQDALDDLAASVRRSGAVPIFIVPPTTESGHFFPTAEREKDLAVFDFSDVRRYPELYSPEHRIDPDHLNTAGARIFSEELAKLFLTLESPPVQAP